MGDLGSAAPEPPAGRSLASLLPVRAFHSGMASESGTLMVEAEGRLVDAI